MKYTLEELEQQDDIDPVEYPDFLEGEELNKFYAKYKFTVVDQSQQEDPYDWWSRNRPNGSFAFRFD